MSALAKHNNSIPLSICNTLIRQDSDGRYCLNDLHKAAGNLEKHKPKFFLANSSVKELIEEISKEGGISPSLVKRGVGTHVVKELVYAYAMWISAKFSLQVIRAYDDMVKKLFPVRNALVDLPTHLPAKKQHLKNVVLTIARKNAEGYGAVYNRLFTALGIDKLANLTDKHYIPACNYLNVKPKVFDGELLPKAKEETQDNSITLTLKPLVNNKHRRVLVTQAKDFMVTLWELDDDQQVLTEHTAIRELRELGYLVLKNDDASINKLVFSYLPSDKLPIFIEKAANRLRAIQQAKLMPA